MEGVDFHAYYVGIIDYCKAFADIEFTWTLIGTLFYIIGLIAFLPETIELIQNGTNYGLSLAFAFGNSLGQWLLVINFLCLNYQEFLGFFNYEFAVSYPSFLVFLDLFTQWILFLPCIYLTMIYEDREFNTNDPPKKRFWAKINCIGLVVINIIISLGLLLLWIFVGTTQGFDCEFLHAFGEFCGMASTVLELIQYIPQFITTIKLRDNGSLSLLMLEIQGPTALANGIYMAVALGESWTTYSCSLVDATAQISLLIICIAFKVCKKTEINETDFSALSVKVLAPLEKSRIYFCLS